MRMQVAPPRCLDGARKRQHAALNADKENGACGKVDREAHAATKRHTVPSGGGAAGGSQLATAAGVSASLPSHGQAGSAGTAAPAVKAATGSRGSMQPTDQDDDTLQPGSPPTQPPPKPKPPPPRSFASKSFYGSKLRLNQGPASSVMPDSGPPAGIVDSQLEQRRRDVDNVVQQWRAGDFMENDVFRTQINARKLEQRYKQEREAGADSSASSSSSLWEEFPTQQPAFDLADSQPGLEVFSFEKGPEGRRKFLVASRAEFFRRYIGLLPLSRHHYEIIRVGVPCHLYFDLEFQVADNPGLDGTAAVDALMALVGEQLQASFQLDLQPSWVWELDSSTDAKFSRHLIIRIPDAAFASNAHVGAFVLQLCAQAKERRDADPRCALLIVKKGGEEEALFVDPAVYSRNRAFRLYLSSKAGKQAVLDITNRFAGASASLTKEDIFTASLITNVPPGCRLLRCFDEDSPEGAAAAAAGRAGRAAAAAQLASLRGVPRGALGVGAAHVNYGPCPYPQLEQFINSICCEGGVQGRVRSWVQLQPDLLVFNIRDNRYCGNVGRQHKSNGIFFVVDLREGSWHQKCYDPDCRHYRSPYTPLPPHLLGLCPPSPTDRPLAAASGAAGWAAADGGSGDADAGWDGEAEEEGWMCQALEQYEQQQQQQEGQQHGQQQPGKPKQLSQQQSKQRSQQWQAQRQQQQQWQEQQRRQEPSWFQDVCQGPAHQQQTQMQPVPSQLREQLVPSQMQQLQQAHVSSRPAVATGHVPTSATSAAEQAAEVSAKVEAAEAEPPDDALLLEALLQYEQGEIPEAAAAADHVLVAAVAVAEP